MTAAISTEGYAFIVGACFFVCSVALVLLAAANAQMMRQRSRRRARALRVHGRHHPSAAVKTMGGGHNHVPAEDRWAA